MKKYVSVLLTLLVGLFAFSACSDTVVDISTSEGGELKVTESDLGEKEETIDPADGEAVTGKAKYESLTITYTTPDGYTETASGGGMVTFSLNGSEVGKIVYVPAPVETAVLDTYYEALEYDAEQLYEYMAQYAEGLDVDYEVTKQDVNGQEAILATGTVAEGSAEGNPGDVAYVLLMPMGDQLVVLRGFADAQSAATIKADLDAFANSLTGTPAASN